MPKEAKDNYSERLVTLDDDAAEVEDILGDVSFTQGSGGTNDELTEARLSNIKARTALLEQKLEEEKQSLWFEWNGLVFSEFSEAFAKVKNTLISLHLNEDQLKTLDDGIDDALKSLKDKLDAMWSKFKNGIEEEEKEQ